jgi:hypothetical protein
MEAFINAFIAALKDTPIPTILVVAGIVFLLLSIAGQLAGRITVPPERQRQATIIGGLLVVVGVALHLVPQPQLKVTPVVTDKGSPTQPAQPPKEPPLQPPGEPQRRSPPSEPSGQASTEEKEPSNDRTTATVITEGTTVRGLIATDQDQDLFRVTPSGSKTRVIVRVHSPSNFIPIVAVYDQVDKTLAMYPASVLQPATFYLKASLGRLITSP